MCGISGILSANIEHTQVHRLRAMTQALQHRGPDGEGHWHNPAQQVALGHRRLSILDLSAAASQPMHYLQRYSIVHNGEIYNYRELRSTLQQYGYSFRSASDTEVICAAYDMWQQECVHMFEGMFAFALWDEKEQMLFAARDRFGEKPFLYHYDGKQLLFASEFKALWAAGVPKAWNHLLLLSYLANGHTQNAVDASLTFYKDIFALPPAHYLTFYLQRRELYVNLYWDLDKQEQKNYQEAEATATFRSLFLESVKKRLRSDVSVGTSLSGGLDSSSVAATIAELPQEEGAKVQAAFTAVFPGFAKDEYRHAQTVAQQFALSHYIVAPEAEDFIRDFERLCYHQEQPFGSASVYAQYRVMQLAKEKGVTVLLDGQGADEILAGYTKYIHWYLQELLGKFRYGFAMQERIRLQQNGYPFAWGFPNYVAAVFPMVANAHLEEKERKKMLMHPHLHPDYAHAHYDKFYSIYKPPVTKLNDILYFNTLQQGLGELLHYADRNSMAHGCEVRLPFLHHPLVEFIFSLPANYKIHHGFTKWLLREAMKDALPATIVWRTDKVGYEPPQQQWMQNKAVIERVIESRRKLVKEGILKKEVESLPVMAKEAYAADNFDWRYLCTAQCG